MAGSSHLGLPFLEAGQAQKHVTHNEALRILDALVQLSVSGVSSSPPGSPAEGERHIVAESASGAFTARENQVAVYEDGAWRFLEPSTGWRAWNEDSEALLVWNGSEWTALETGGGGGGGGGFDPEDVDHIYLNDSAPGDSDVKFSMRGEAALLHAIPAAESGNGDVRLQISKESAGDTASVFFSTNFSGRAEFGLAGSDNFKLKVSADGSSWTEALDIDKSTGRVRLPAAVALNDPDQVVARRDVREVLFANRFYYVRTDGSDSNSGLTNASGGAFLTLQKAIDVVAALDISIYAVTIHVGAGTYTASAVVSAPWIGTGYVLLEGDNTTPSNVVLNTNGPAIHVLGGGRLRVRGFKIATSNHGLRADTYGAMQVTGNMEFGTCSASHVNCNNAYIAFDDHYSVTGNAARHWQVSRGGLIIGPINGSKTITLTGTPAFSSVFADAGNRGGIDCANITFSGSATGTRYLAAGNGTIFVNGAGATYLPGNASGSTATGGQYF
jgi:hypothetical protein